MNQKFIITGAPGTGKTSIINELKKRGHLCAPEINPSNISNKKIKNNRLLLSEFLFQNRQIQYTKSDDQLMFFDRSMIDVIAYLIYWKEPYPTEWNKTIKKLQYFNNIFYTPCWKKIYTNTNYRQETFQESAQIDTILKKTYLDYNYNITEIPKLDVTDRVEFILQHI